MRIIALSTLLALCFAVSPYNANIVECESCRVVIASLQYYLKNPDHYTSLVNLLNEMCDQFENSAVCRGAINEFEPVAIEVLLEKFVDPDRLCLNMGYCSSPTYVPENFTQFVTTVMKGKPSGPGPSPSGKGSFKFVHISDIHIDKFYEPGTNADCGLPQCCRTGNGTAGAWGGYICDIPSKTLDAALEQVASLKPDFVIVTGDYPPHDVWNQSREYNLGYQTIVSQAFKKYLSDVPVYPMYGNHAVFPINQYKFGLEQYMPEPFCNAWGLSDLVKLDLQLNAGYTLRHKLTNLRIIAIDTQAGNSGNFYLAINSTDPQGLISWLYKKLLEAESSKEAVYIIGHIPPGDVDCFSIWSRHFNVLLDRFEYTIAGIFFGHTHKDEFHINRGVYSYSPIMVQWIAPSLTTYTKLNPSFRVFEADVETKVLLDYSQYRLNLTNANLYPDQTPLWDNAYSFKEFYGITDLKPQTVYELALNIGGEESLAVKYLDNFYAGNNPSSVCDIRCLSELMCKLTYGINDDILNCQGIDSNWVYKLFELFAGNWTYKVK